MVEAAVRIVSLYAVALVLTSATDTGQTEESLPAPSELVSNSGNVKLLILTPVIVNSDAQTNESTSSPPAGCTSKDKSLDGKTCCGFCAAHCPGHCGVFQNGTGDCSCENGDFFKAAPTPAPTPGPPPVPPPPAPTPAPPGPGPSPDPSMDFLIQDVCTNAQGEVIPGDPVACTYHRDLRPGEILPYHKHDYSLSHKVMYQLCDAFPLLHSDGSLRVVHTLDFADCNIRPCQAVSNLTFVQFDVGTDGFNANQARSDFVSIVGTEDPSCLDQRCPEYFVAPDTTENGKCSLMDSWGLWRKDLFTKGNGSHLFELNIQRGIPPSTGTCPTSYNAAFTTFDMLDKFTFQSGKTLQTIRQQHWGGTSFEAANAGEKEFFTREYGLTRWEAWQVDGSCGPSGTSKCVPDVELCGETGAREDKWVRVDCRDWSFISADPDGGYPPQRFPVPSTLITGGNMLDNGDWGRGVSSMGSTSRWKIISESTTHWSLEKGAGTTNYFLQVGCIGECNGNAVYQDVQVPSFAQPGASFAYGGQIWATAPGLSAGVTLFQLAADGSIVHRSDALAPTAGSGQKKQVRGEEILRTSTTHLRWTFYLPAANTKPGADASYFIDNAFVAVA